MRIVVASNNEAISTQLREILSHAGKVCQVSDVVRLELAEHHLLQHQVEMVVLVLSPDPQRALAILRKLRGLVPGTILATGPASEPKLILRALHEGADQYLDETELETELQAVLQMLQVRSNSKVPSGRLITVLASSGGSGSSTLAVNTATVLAQEHKTSALIDLKLGIGDLAALLNLKPNHTLADLCQNASRMDRTMFERSLVRHESGVYLLSAPQTFSDIHLVTARGVNQILALARAVFPYVVVDMDDCFHAEQVQTLRQSGITLLVLRLDFTSLRNAQRILSQLDQMEIPRERLRLVINRYGQAKELPVAKVEEALGMKIAHYIPDDPKTINWANNAGHPAVLEAPSAKVSRSLTVLARSINGCLTAYP
jgi:pilus assembly protein CpaE